MGFFIVALDLFTKQEPGDGYFLIRHWGFYVYITPYAVLSAVAFYYLKELEAEKILNLPNMEDLDWLKAITLGLITRSLVHINVFTIQAGGQTIPIGPSLLFQKYEPRLLKQIDLDLYHSINAFVEPHVGSLHLSQAIEKYLNNAPPSGDFTDKDILRNDLLEKDDPQAVLYQYMKSFGKKNFMRVYGPQKS